MFYFYPQVVCFYERLTSHEIKLKLKDGGTCNIVNNANIKQSFFKSCSQDIYTITTGLLKKICKDGCIELCTKKIIVQETEERVSKTQGFQQNVLFQ